MPTIVVVHERSRYPVTVGRGLLSTLNGRISKVTDLARRKIFVLTSPEIWALWSVTFLESFPTDQKPTVLFLPAGEVNKRLRHVEYLADQLAEAGADRSSLLLAFGGGVVGDVCGFLAAIYMRGIDYIQVPTTLLAQVDSSLGGKTGANLAAGKNLIGCFHQPLAVFSDSLLLQTLPAREVRAGLFESIKAGIIRDSKLFRFMERRSESVLRRDPAALEYVVAASVRVKAEVVAVDEHEKGLRMILNFGHTLGHAIEAATRYRKVLHGEAVAWGMLGATRLGVARGTLTTKDAEKIERLILAYGPLPALRLPVERLLDATARDKKNRAGVRRFILPSGVGNAVVVEDVTDEELRRAAESMLASARHPESLPGAVQ